MADKSIDETDLPNSLLSLPYDDRVTAKALRTDLFLITTR